MTFGISLIRKKFEEVSSAEKWLLENQNCLIELTISTEEFLKSEDRKKIFSAHQGIIYLIPKVKNNQMEDSPDSEINLNQNLKSLFRDYFKSKNDGMGPNKELMNLYDENRQA